MFAFNKAKLRDRIHACWIGKNIGGTMGTPFEGRRDINDIQGFSTPANVILPNDDLDLQLVWLKATEDRGPYSVNAQILGEYWINFIPPHWNEYGIGKSNMKAGLLPPLSGEYKNDWKHSNGAWIRTEIWACMAPGCPDVALKYAMEDACVDHGMGEGTYAAIFVAALESAAFIEHDIRKLIDIGLSKIPLDCRVARSMQLLLKSYDDGIDWKTTRNLIVEDSADLGWFEAPANVAFTMLGMLYGEGDFKKSMILAINCGDDTDCTGATLGALFGILGGTEGIPQDWEAHLGDEIVTVAVDKGSCYGLPKTCTQLTDRVLGMIPVMLKANSAQVYLTDGEDNIADYKQELFMKKEISEKLRGRPGRSFDVDFIYAGARVVFEGEPEIEALGSVKIKVEFTNRFPDPKHLQLRWILPEGWSVKTRREVYLPHVNAHTKGAASVEAEITAGENVEAVNRLILEVVCPARPTVGLIPVQLFG